MNEEKVEIFSKAVTAALYKWTALTLAVENQWGGRFSYQKREVFCNDTILLFLSGRRVTLEKLSDFLAQRICDLFYVHLEDNSEDELSRLLLDLYSKCKVGDFTLAQKLQLEKPVAAVHASIGITQKDAIESDSSEASSDSSLYDECEDSKMSQEEKIEDTEMGGLFEDGSKSEDNESDTDPTISKHRSSKFDAEKFEEGEWVSAKLLSKNKSRMRH